MSDKVRVMKMLDSELILDSVQILYDYILDSDISKADLLKCRNLCNSLVDYIDSCSEVRHYETK